TLTHTLSHTLTHTHTHTHTHSHTRIHTHTHTRIHTHHTPGVLNKIPTHTQSNVDRSQNQNFNLNLDPSEFLLLRDFVLYIFFLFDVVSIFRVQSRGPIRSCNNNITMTTHSLNVGRELCGSRRLC